MGARVRLIGVDINGREDWLVKMSEGCTVQLGALSRPTAIGTAELGGAWFKGHRLAPFAPYAAHLTDDADALSRSRELAVDPSKPPVVDNTPMGSEADRWRRRREQRQKNKELGRPRNSPTLRL